MQANFPENSFPKRFYIQFKPHKICKIPLQIFQMNYLLKRIKIQQNIYLMGALGQSNDSYIVQLYTIAAFFFILILIAAVLMIARFFLTQKL